VRFTRGARKHRVGRAHALHVMTTIEPIHIPATQTEDERLVWVGPDDRGVELEIVAVLLQDQVLVLVIHVMPTGLRRNR
jgi:phage gp46-like protein